MQRVTVMCKYSFSAVTDEVVVLNIVYFEHVIHHIIMS